MVPARPGVVKLFLGRRLVSLGRNTVCDGDHKMSAGDARVRPSTRQAEDVATQRVTAFPLSC